MTKYKHPIKFPIFLLHFLVTFLLTFIVACGIYITQINGEKESYQITLNKRSQEITSILSGKISNMIQVGQSIFNNRWYKHYTNSTGSYTDEFDLLHRMDISQELRNLRLSMEFVSDIVIITPGLNSCITTNGWFTLDEYLEYYKSITFFVRDNKEIEGISTLSDTVSVLVCNEATRHLYESKICIIISRTGLEKYLSVLSEGKQIIEVFAQNKLLGKNDTSITDPQVISLPMSIPDSHVTLSFPSFQSTFWKGKWVVMLLTLILMIALSIIVSMLLTNYHSAPLTYLYARLGLNSDLPFLERPYEKLTNHVDMVLAQREQLADENQRLNALSKEQAKTIQQYRLRSLNEILFRLLTNQDVTSIDKETEEIIPWIFNEPCILMMIILSDNNAEKANSYVQDVLTKEASHYLTYRYMVTSIIVLAWFNDSEQAQNAIQPIISANKQADNYSLLFSPVISDPTEISTCFHDLMSLHSQNMNLKKNILSIPFEKILRLIRSIYAHSSEDCRELLTDFRCTFSHEEVFETLSSIAVSFEIDITDLAQLYLRHCKKHHTAHSEEDQNACWNALLLIMDEICTQANILYTDEKSESLKIIKEYVDEHYMDSQLSIKQLVDIFNMSESAISRIFHTHSDQGFQQYLQSVRLKHAIALINGGDKSLSDIAANIGFINYRTFARVFQRVYGMSPSEYRELFHG